MTFLLQPRKWFACTLVVLGAILLLAAALVWWVDPYFHYRAPRTDRFRYTLDSQRFQNDGIVRHFDYRALITGSSMIENFKTSDIERLWGLKAVKVPFAGASYRELARLVCRAAAANPDLELVIVGLDFNKLIMAPGWMRTELGDFPDYLYDENPWNDISYLLNRDAVLKSLKAVWPWSRPGITSFDDYSRWHTEETRYGARAVLAGADYRPVSDAPQQAYSEADAALVAANIRENLEPIMNCGRRVLFFVTPYSAARMYYWRLGGRLECQLQAERQLAEAVLAHPNVRLFSFNDQVAITGDLANYRDLDHYGPWVCTRILEEMRSGEGELTRTNLSARMDAERRVYRDFDYRKMFDGHE